MESRKESLSVLKVCRFCLTQNEPLITLYDKNKAPHNLVTLSTKILTCIGVEIYPSDKMPQYICNKCKFFMELCYGFKHVCRKSDQNILHYIQHGTPLEPLHWTTLLNKVFRAHTKSEFGLVKSVTQDGATVKVTAEEVTDSEEEGDDDNVYSVKIGDGSEELKSIKVITSVDNLEPKENKKVKLVCNSEEPAPVQPVVVKHGCWPCDECNCTYPLEQLLAVHKSQRHRPRSVQCDDCGAKFYTKPELMVHEILHDDSFPFQCVACDKKFKLFSQLKRHEKLHRDLPQLKCSNCPATFLSDIELEAHGIRHLPSIPRRFGCTICDKRFLDSSGLHKHMETCHKKKPAFDCNYCSERFSNMTKLAKHLRTHAGNRAYPCKHCDKTFVKSHHYTRHVRVKHSDVTRAASGSMDADAYRCEECEDTFTTQDELIYHSALHATRSLTCPLCQEKFDDVDTVTTHIKSHVNGAEFMCDFCELIFTTQEKLDSHLANCHENELNEKDMAENDLDGDSMDTEGYEDDSSINVKEENGHMIVEIKKAGEYMYAEPEPMEDDDRTDIDTLEATELEITLDASGPLLASKPAIPEEPGRKTPKPVKDVCSVLSAVKKNTAPSITKSVSNLNVETVVLDEQKNEESQSIKKNEEIKRKVIQQQSLPVSSSDKKDKTNSKVESTRVESSSAAGASDLSLRLLEKELQDLQRTNTRNDVAKTPAKPTAETLRNKRSFIHTSTPKPRATEKKEAATPKSAPEKPVQEKRPPGRPPKENREVKNTNVKEDKDIKEKSISSTKEEKEAKEVKDKETPQVLKNGASERTSVDEPVRRSTRPSKVKDYAKMIRDSPDEEEEDSEEDSEDEEPKEAEKSVEIPRRGRKPKSAPTPAPAVTTPASAPRKRGRPRRKEPSAVPTKVAKKDESEGEDDSEANSSSAKPDESKDKDDKPAEEAKTQETKVPAVAAPVDLPSNVIVSPSGQTLKKVPIKALPPGVKPLPLPRKIASVCEMQIGKKVVKVQKIVMTKAEVEAMTKKGLVEMKDGTIVLKQGIKLPGSAAVLKSPVVSEEQKKNPPTPQPKPTRCDLGED